MLDQGINEISTASGSGFGRAEGLAQWAQEEQAVEEGEISIQLIRLGNQDAAAVRREAWRKLIESLPFHRYLSLNASVAVARPEQDKCPSRKCDLSGHIFLPEQVHAIEKKGNV